MERRTTMGDDTEELLEREAFKSHPQLVIPSPNSHNSRPGHSLKRPGDISRYDDKYNRSFRYNDSSRMGDSSRTSRLGENTRRSRESNQNPESQRYNVSFKHHNDYNGELLTAVGSPVAAAMRSQDSIQMNHAPSPSASWVKTGHSDTIEIVKDVSEPRLGNIGDDQDEYFAGRDISDAIRRINDANHSLHSGHSIKRRKYDSSGHEISITESTPPLILDVDFDHELDSHLEYSVLSNGHSTTASKSSNKIGKLNMEPGPHFEDPQTETDNDERYRVAEKTITELRTALKAKEQEIKALKTTIAEMSSTREADLEKLKKDLHREYSRQASERLRELYRKAEARAQMKSDREHIAEIAALKKQVKTEREEKSELVKACDTYLHLQGF